MSGPSFRSEFRRRSAECSPPEPFEPHPRLQAIVRAYIAQFRAKSAAELESFRGEPTLGAAIRRAGLAQRSDGKRYRHQCRLPAALLREVSRKLLLARLGEASDFNDLHERVRNAIGSLHGVGRLMVYDTSLRIGAKMGHLPQRVYLHTGTREGARALGLNWRAEHLDVHDMPVEFAVLEPHEIEDCLCIFKSQLREASVGAVR